jgi:molecular chaperone DnaK (HSP70)
MVMTKESPISQDARFIVGIDLGTTNSALAYIDLQTQVEGRRRIEIFDIAQLTGPGEVSRLPVLPSFLYLPGRFDIAPEAIQLPWSRASDRFVGAFARDHGAKVPARLVNSAKSWLCHGRVDREAPILPRAAGEDIPKVSPVAATAAYLEHLRQAWNHHWGEDEDLYLEHQHLIITVPASFDEVARDLTAKAATRAGLPGAVLLEEPLAAFYSWLSDHEETWPNQVSPGELVVVCDVGGGTTDFTLITLQPAEGGPRFERIAVGDHLILGGDNIDIALARAVLARMGRAPASMPLDQYKSLCHQCRQAKERLLDGAVDSCRITVAGGGSRLIAGTLSAELTREAVVDLVMERFFPVSGRSSVPPVDIEGFHDLPYTENEAITGHLIDFLQHHRMDTERLLQRCEPRPDLILFNGGSLKSQLIQERIRQALADQFGPAEGPRVLNNPRPDLAVAVGAAYYGWVKSGRGVRVGSGSPRAYYLGVAGPEKEGAVAHAVCLVERGLEEGSRIALDAHRFEVVANRPVRFDLFASSFRSGDRCGDLVPVDETLSRLAPLETVIGFGRGDETRRIPVQVEAAYSETGTLSLWCASQVSAHRWQLRFQLRGATAAAEIPMDTAIDTRILEAAARTIKQGLESDDPRQVGDLFKILAEAVQITKDDWPLGLLRTVADALFGVAARRRVTPVHEAAWLNLLGYSLRPGFGDGADPHRIRQSWRVYLQGPRFDGKPQVRSEWWILWRRISGGLNAGQQRQFLQDIAAPLAKERPGSAVHTEMWMALASMERLLVKDKVKWGRRLLETLTPRKPVPQLFWALGRLGARELLYGSVDRVIPPGEAVAWIRRLISQSWRNPKPVAAAVVQLARRTGDRTRDLDPENVEAVVRWLTANGDARRQLQIVRETVDLAAAEQGAVFGEALPSGLVLKKD